MEEDNMQGRIWNKGRKNDNNFTFTVYVQPGEQRNDTQLGEGKKRDIGLKVKKHSRNRQYNTTHLSKES